MSAEVHTQMPDGTWVEATPIPFYEPPSLRSRLWALVRFKPQPEWKATTYDPTKHERRSQR